MCDPRHKTYRSDLSPSTMLGERVEVFLEQGGHRGPQNAEALSQGDAPLAFEAASLVQNYLDDFGGKVSEGVIASKWLRHAEIVH